MKVSVSPYINIINVKRKLCNTFSQVLQKTRKQGKPERKLP